MMRMDAERDPRDWARAILDKVEKGIHVHPIAAEYALEALVGHPRHREPGQPTAEVIPFPVAATPAVGSTAEEPSAPSGGQSSAQPAPAPRDDAPEMPAWEGPVDDYWWNDED